MRRGVDYPWDAAVNDSREDPDEDSRGGKGSGRGGGSTSGGSGGGASGSNIPRRKPAQTLPARMGPVWRTVEVIGKEMDTNPDHAGTPQIRT